MQPAFTPKQAVNKAVGVSRIELQNMRKAKRYYVASGYAFAYAVDHGFRNQCENNTVIVHSLTGLVIGATPLLFRTTLIIY